MEAGQPESRYDFKEGALLLIDKPKTWTSFDVVNKIRYKLKHKLGVRKIKVGHSGTLDPMATGLLVICTGRWTKRLNQLQGLPKTYTGTMKLGVTTPSYDAETAIDEIFPIDHITSNLMETKRRQFVGRIPQVPPTFSAIKVDGQPLYKRARRGEKFKVEPRMVEIKAFSLTDIDLPYIGFKVECSKGTYIRSLAHDFGKALNSGAYLTSLQRTSIGQYHLEDAWKLEDFLEYVENNY